MYRGIKTTLVVGAMLLMISSWCISQSGDTGRITGVHFLSFPKSNADGSVTFTLSIEGENLPPNKAAVGNVVLETKDPAEPVRVDELVSSDPKEVVVKATAKAKAEITRIKVTGENPKNNAETLAFTIAFAENPTKPKPEANAVKKIEIKLDDEKNATLPNVHTLVITKTGGEGDFDDDPYKLTVDLLPSGASDIKIIDSNPEEVDVHFVAPEGYVPKGAVVTVYDATDLRTRKAAAIGEVKKEAEDTDKPKVDHINTVFINRSHGVGRIQIIGEGFGTTYQPPPYPASDFLWNCLEEFHIRGTNPDDKHVIDLETDDLLQRLKACGDLVGLPSKDTNQEWYKDWDKDWGKDKQKEKLRSLRERLIYTKSDLATILRPDNEWDQWSESIRKSVTVGLVSRNSDIQVEKVEILEINDKMIDVYFEFTRYRGFAYPLLLDTSSITIKKNGQKATQTVKNDKLKATVAGPKTYVATYDFEPKRDPNLTYKYLSYSETDANTLFGKGVGQNFYVLQLSVLNNGKKKVAVPLAAMQAEIQWRRGSNKNKANVAGPPTLPPAPLGAVSGYFEAYQKANGLRAHLFNAFEAASVMATALVPFAGPSLKDAEVYFSGGFVPGFKKLMGDISSQQLQRLTSSSWESSETLAANGGSVAKYIYIPKRGPRFGSKDPGFLATQFKGTDSEIGSIVGLEVYGYEVTESDAKSATPEDKSKQPTTNDKGSSTPKGEASSSEGSAQKED